MVLSEVVRIEELFSRVSLVIEFRDNRLLVLGCSEYGERVVGRRRRMKSGRVSKRFCNELSVGVSRGFC